MRIDATYIEEEGQRLRMYKRIAGAADDAAIADLSREMQDRYGPMPEPVEFLMEAGRLRLLAERVGVTQIDRKGPMAHMRFTEHAQIDPEILMKMVARNSKRGAQFTPQGVLRFPIRATSNRDILQELRQLIESLEMPTPPSTDTSANREQPPVLASRP